MTAKLRSRLQLYAEIIDRKLSRRAAAERTWHLTLAASSGARAAKAARSGDADTARRLARLAVSCWRSATGSKVYDCIRRPDAGIEVTP